MKTIGKIIICIIVVLVAVGVAYLVYDKQETSGNPLTNTNSSSSKNQNTTSNTQASQTNTTVDKNTEYIGAEENKKEEEVPQEDETLGTTDSEQEQNTEELTGKDKAIDIVKRKYALDGQEVEYHHMEGNDYVINMNNNAVVTWFLVDGETWEVEEY